MNKLIYKLNVFLIILIPSITFSHPWEMGLSIYNNTTDQLVITNVRLYKENDFSYPYRQGTTSGTLLDEACDNININGISDINGDEVSNNAIWDPIIIDADVVDEEVFYLVIKLTSEARFCKLVIPAEAYPESPTGDFVGAAVQYHLKSNHV